MAMSQTRHATCTLRTATVIEIRHELCTLLRVPGVAAVDLRRQHQSVGLELIPRGNHRRQPCATPHKEKPTTTSSMNNGVAYALTGSQQPEHSQAKLF
jgi:hypothetical protein